jgi:hypothetical protein
MIDRRFVLVAALALTACGPKKKAAASADLAAGKAFLANNAKQPGVKDRPLGARRRPAPAQGRRGEGQLRRQAPERQGVRQLL